VEVGRTLPIRQAETKARLIRELERTGGHISRTAWLMNLGRMSVYRYIERFGLWPVVNRTRRERLEGRQPTPTTEPVNTTLMERTRLALRGG